MLIPFRGFFNSAFTAQSSWHRKYLVFLLFFLFFFLHVAMRTLQHRVTPKNASLGTLAGLYLCLATGMFLLMQAWDTLKKTRSVIIRIALVVVTGAAFVVWLLVLLLWLINVFGF